MAKQRRPDNDSIGRRPTRRARVEELEPRVLLSADAPWAVLDATLSEATQQPLESVELESSREVEASRTEQQASSKELVFVDAGIDDYETLVEDLLAQSPDASRSIEVVVLDSDRDGITQISEALAGRSGLDAVHVVSHGTEQGIQLGGTWLSGSSLDAYSEDIAQWRDRLSEEADLLLYGCNLAGSADGKALIDQLAGLTGADVAASLDATGAALLGGDWDLEHTTGSVESAVAFSAQAQTVFMGVLGDTAIWVTNGETTPEASSFDGLNFSASVPTVDVGNRWKVIAGAEAPTRDEAIVVGVGNDGQLSGMVWNGTNWVAVEPVELGIPNLSGTENWSIDVSYESQSGDALVVWSAGKDLAYDFGWSVWNGTSFTAATPLDGPVSGEPIQLKLASNPNSDEIVLVASNEANQTYAMVWDGSSWNSGEHFVIGDSSVDVTDISVAYEQQSGDAMVVYGGSNSDAHYRIWDGSVWSGGPIADGGGPSSNVKWTTLASDPNSDRIVLGVETDFNTAWVAVWDGDAWEPSVLASNNTLHSDRQNLAVAFESASGEAIATYTRQAEDNVRYQRWTAGEGWSGELVGPTLSSHPDSMTLDADPTSDSLMLSLVEQNRQVSFTTWNGDSWGTPQVLGADAGTNKAQPFLFLWDQQPSVANTTPTADASAGGAYVISEGDTLNLDGSASSDFDGSIVSWEWDISNDGSFEKTGVNASFDWTELIAAGVDDDGTYDVALRVTDDGGAQNTRVFTLKVDNTAPTITVTGAATVEQGQVFTLNLSAVDPGNETIAGWTINWGDGRIDMVGDVASATHTYMEAGFTRNITVSVRDEDGTYMPGDVFLTSNVTDSLYRYDATSAGLLQEFADLDGLNNPVDVEIGPDGLIYVTGFASGDIRRYDATTGAFVDQFVSGLSAPPRMAFGPDGNLYVTNSGTDEVLRFDGVTGAPLGAFVTAGSGTLNFPDGIAFGPDGDLYVASDNNGKVLRYDGATGAFIEQFAAIGSTGFTDLKFGPDGNLYVSNVPLNTIQRFNGTTGVKIDDFVTAGSGGMSGTAGFEFGPDGNLYVVDFYGDTVLRYDGTNGSFIDEYIPSSGPNAPINLTFAPAHQVLVTGGSNAAPQLSPAAPNLTPITEDDVANPGDLVSSIVGGSITDTDSTALQGIAITGLNSSNGTWEYSLDGGLVWNTIPLDVSDTTALLLRDTDLVRFVPDGENADAASFDFRAWDQTMGTADTQFDVSSNGLDTAFSSDFDTASIVVSAVNDAPTLANTTTGQLVTDTTTVDPFASVTIADVDNPSQTLTVDIQLDDGAKGTLTNLGGFTDLGAGLYRFTGTATAATTAIQGLTFDPTENRVVPGGTETTTFTISVDDGVATPVVDASTTVISTSVNDAPTIANTTAGQLVTDTTTVDPFASVTIADVDNPSQTLTVDIQLDDAAKGTLTNLGGFTDLGAGLYRFTGTATAATTAIQGLTFDPTENRVVPGGTETTTFTISVDDGVATPVVDSTTTVLSTSVNDAPTIANTTAGQLVTDTTTVDPFSTVTIADVDAPGQTLTVDIQLDDGAKGTLTNLGGFTDLGAGLYRFTGTATAATTAIQGLTFDPTENRVVPGGTETTTFTISVDDGVATPVVDSTTTVLSTSVNDAPTIANTTAGQLVTDTTTVDPFSTVTIADVDAPGQTLTVDIQLDDGAKGTLTNLGGFTDLGAGLYRFTGTATAATTAIQGLTFDPTENRVVPGGTETTTFTISVDDGVATPVVDSTTTVLSTSVNDAPTIANTTAGQLVTDTTTVDPFASVTIADVDNPSQTLTVDIQLDDGAKGTLTNLGGFTDLGAGLYRFTGTATAATTAIQGLTFDPTENRVVPGGTETTTFTVSVDDGVATPVVDASTTVISTAVNDAPTIANTTAGQLVTDTTTVDPFASVTIADVDNPSQTLTVDIQLDDGAKGTLTNLGGFTDLGAGLYRFTGTATAATTAIQGLTFDPTENRVVPGGTETTTFTISVDDGVAPPTVDSTTTVISTSVNDAPVLDPTGDMTLTNVSESDPNPIGNTVATIISSAGGDRITDADIGAAEGIAVVSVDDSNGSWQYSTDGGVIWTAFGSVSDTTAVLLDASGMIRFVPSVGYTGPSGDIVFHAWDQTAGSNGQANANASSTGGSNAFSIASETATLDVTALNFAPVLTPSGPSLPTITEDDVRNPGERVSTIVGGSISDANSSALEGIAITRLSSGNGSWQHSLDGGATWNNLPATISDSAALLLSNTDRIRFVPDGQNADAASFDFRAWDQTSGSTGTQIDVTTHGGQTAFSAAVDTASIRVTALNDAPTLGDATLAPVREDETDPQGATIASLFGRSFADVDAGSGFAGVAVIGNSADSATQGVWQYSSDGGVSWFAIGVVGDGASAIALESATEIRFVPVSNFEGSPLPITVRSLDDTYGGGFSSTVGGSEIRTHVDTSTNGGESEISGTRSSLSTSVLPSIIATDLALDDSLLEEQEEPQVENPTETAEDAPTEDEPDAETIPVVLPDDLTELPTNESASGGSSGPPRLQLDLADFGVRLPPETMPEAEVIDDEDRREESTARTAINALTQLFEGRSLIDGTALANLIFGGERSEFMSALDSIQQDVELLTGFEARMARSAIAATTGLSVGYVLWLTRGGLLMASLLSSLPAWRLIDPIPILASLDLGDDEAGEDEESLDSLLRGDEGKSESRAAEENERDVRGRNE